MKEFNPILNTKMDMDEPETLAVFIRLARHAISHGGTSKNARSRLKDCFTGLALADSKVMRGGKTRVD